MKVRLWCADRLPPPFTVYTFASIPLRSCVYRANLTLGNVESEEIHIGIHFCIYSLKVMRLPHKVNPR